MSMHLFRSPHDTERGTGKPGYRWVPCYYQVTESGFLAPAMTRKEAREQAKRDGVTVVFHETEEQARAAAGFAD